MTTVAEISSKLTERVLAVATMLLPGGKETRGEYLCGSVNGGEGNSLKVKLQGEHAGNWKDWATPEHHGDLLDLWRLVRNVSPGEAITQAKEWLGIRDGAAAAQKKVYKPAPEKPTPPPTPEGRAHKWLTEIRKLRQETLDGFKVAIEPGSRPAIIFPCYSPSGVLVNRSYRTLPKDGAKKDVWQDPGCGPCLFGWHMLTPAVYSSRTVMICEGQIDAMTWHQWGIPCLSIPNGSGQTWIEYEWENLQAFDTLLIAFDMDGAGRENSERAVKRLGAHRCMLVSIPHKDANAGLQAGATAAQAAQWVSEARAPQFNGLVTASGLGKRLRAHLQPRQKAFTLPFFDKNWPTDGLFFRDGEVTLWTGNYGNGKSTFLNALTVGIMHTGRSCFIASMEAKAEVVLHKIATGFLISLGCYLCDNGAFRDAQGKEHEPMATYDGFVEGCGDKLIFADVVGYINPDRLLEMMLFAFRRYDCRQFMIDSVMRIEGLEEDYPLQGKFMNRLQEFAKDTGSHVHLVAHPRKMEKGGRPSGMDIKGASLFANNADNIVSVSRNHEKFLLLQEGDGDDEEIRKMHDTEITVDKQRDSGWVGSFYFKFDRRDYTFTPCKKYEKPKAAPKRNGRDW